MRSLTYCSAILATGLYALAARADTFAAYSYFDANSYTPLGIDASGDVLISPGPGTNYTIWNAGVQLYSGTTIPGTFIPDNGSPCAAPSGVSAFPGVRCNGAFEVYSTDGRDLFEIYPGSPVLGTEIQNSLTSTYDTPSFLNANGDVAFVDGRDELQREIIRIPAAVTPEPSTLGFMGTGLLTFALLRRRRGLSG